MKFKKKIYHEYSWIKINWPIDKGLFWISSRFFDKRKKSNGTIKLHAAVDLAALKGTPVKASLNGIILNAEYIKGYGNCVFIDHGNNIQTRYGHLSKITVKRGDHVISKKTIGLVGASGNVRGKKDPSHLHFELIINGKKYDPIPHFIW